MQPDLMDVHKTQEKIATNLQSIAESLKPTFSTQTRSSNSRYSLAPNTPRRPNDDRFLTYMGS
jgi:hypothetical protein